MFGLHALRLAEAGAGKIRRMRRRRRHIDPAAARVRASRRVDQALHTISLGHARRGGVAALTRINQSPHQAADPRDAWIRGWLLVGILNRDPVQRVVAPAPEPEVET